jgi:hypothetical protein
VSTPRLALPLLLACAAPAGAADWALAPRFSLNGEYNSNPYLDYQNVDHRSGGTFDALLPLTAKTERTDFALALGGHLRRYDNDPSGNRDDESLDMSIAQTRERSGWKGSLGWTRDTTLTSELGTTGLTQSNRRHNRYYASIAPQIQLSQVSLVAFGVSGELSRYENAAALGLLNYGYASVFASYARQTSEVTTVGVGAVVAGQSVPDAREQETVNGLVRLTLAHQFSERLSLESYAAPSYARSRTQDRWGASGSLALKYAGLRTDFSFSAEHQFAPAGRGSLTTRDSVALGMSNRLTEKLTAGTTLSYQRSRDALLAPGASQFQTYYWRAEESLRWQWAETLSTALSAGYTRQDRRDVPDYADRFIASLGFTWTPRPLF